MEEEIGKLIKEQISPKYSSYGKLARELSEVMELGAPAISHSLGQISKGDLCFGCSQEDDPRNLERIATVFYFLDVQENNNLIAKMLQYNQNFDYPPKKEIRNNILSYKRGKELSRLLGPITTLSEEQYQYYLNNLKQSLPLKANKSLIKLEL